MADKTQVHGARSPSRAAATAVFMGGAMLLHNKTRLVFTVIGIAVAFFLAASQIGLLVGWVRMNSALITHANVDLWVMAKQTPAFDYATPIPRQAIYRARSVPGVATAQGMVQCWAYWQRSDGRRVNVEVVGLDTACIGGPWVMGQGSISAVHRPDAVIVDELSCGKLGVAQTGDSFEINGARAVVEGICREVRTFTTSPFVFTSISAARRYDGRFGDDEITFALARCEAGADVPAVQAEMQRRLPEFEVLTTREFALRTVKYWMLETGAGITVVITAALGLGVGALIMSQTLFAITNDHLPNYATLLALGFRRSSLLAIVLVQSVALGLCGIGVGSALFFPAASASARTPIPLETTPLVFAGLVAAALASCVAASAISVRSIFRVDPVSVFRQ